MRLLNEMAKRGVAVLLLAATAFASITYSLGVYDLSFIDRPDKYYDDERTQEILETLAPGTNISEFTGDLGEITTSPSTDTPVSSDQISNNTTAPEATIAPSSGETEQPGTTTAPDIPVNPEWAKPLADYLSAGYSITWADFDPKMEFAEITLAADGLDKYTQGNYKRVRVQLKKNYGENHREISYYALKQE